MDYNPHSDLPFGVDSYFVELLAPAVPIRALFVSPSCGGRATAEARKLWEQAKAAAAALTPAEAFAELTTMLHPDDDLEHNPW